MLLDLHFPVSDMAMIYQASMIATYYKAWYHNLTNKDVYNTTMWQQADH